MQDAPHDRLTDEEMRELLELLAWKRDAIARYPELALLPGPMLIEGEA